MALVHAAASRCLYLVLLALGVSYWAIALFALAHRCVGGGVRILAGASVWCARSGSIRKGFLIRQPVRARCRYPWPARCCRTHADSRRLTRSSALPGGAFGPIARGGTSADQVVCFGGSARVLRAVWRLCGLFALARRRSGLPRQPLMGYRPC